MNNQEYMERIQSFSPELKRAYLNSGIVNRRIKEYAHGGFKTKEETLTQIVIDMAEVQINLMNEFSKQGML